MEDVVSGHLAGRPLAAQGYSPGASQEGNSDVPLCSLKDG